MGFKFQLFQVILYHVESDIVSSITDYLNDLWMFNTKDNQWTWLNGSQNWNDLGSYKNLGVASWSNWPSSRGCHSMSLDHIKGLLYIFGGEIPSDSRKLINDLWAFNLTSNLWTWLSGSNSSCSTTPNDPGPRAEHTAELDPQKGMLYMFGGKSCTGML